MPVVSSVVTDPTGQPGRATVTIRLITTSPTTPGYSAAGETVGRSAVPVSSGGAWSATLVGNDDITPAGSYYEVVEAIPATGDRAISTIVVPSTGGPFAVKDLLYTPPTT